MPNSTINPFVRFGSWLSTEVQQGVKAVADSSVVRALVDVEDFSEALLDQGIDKFISSPKLPPPVYAFPTAEEKEHNVRDVGVSAAASATADGKHLQPGVLTRMDAPRETDRGRYQGKVEIDLRSASEIKKDTAPSWRGSPGFAYQSFPIEPLGAYNTFDTKRDLAFARTMLLLQAGNKVVVHCTHGVDRTGMDVAMTMLSLGYDQAAALDEYLISGQSPEGPQTDPEVWTDAVQNALKAHGGNIVTYVAYLNDLLAANGVKDRIDLTTLRAKVLR